MTRAAVAAALVGFAVPALACDSMKGTHASTTTSSSSAKADKAEKTQKSEKASKKADAKKDAVASAEAKR